MELSDMGNKDPAMLFYTSDFLTGTTLLTMRERGQYITLLCLQQQLGHMRRQDMEKVVGRMSAALLEKFCADGEGRLYNARAEAEIEKRSAHCKLQKEKIQKRWAYSGTTGELPLEDENENRDEIIIKDEIEDISSEEAGECERAIKLYADSIEPAPSKARTAALRSYCALLSPEAVCHAINVAADNNKKSWSYIKAILLRYTSQNIRTKADIERDEQRRRSGASGSTSARGSMDIAALQEISERL